MIRSFKHAVEVQKRRHESGKLRLAGAVKRYLKRAHLEDRQYADLLQFRRRDDIL